MQIPHSIRINNKDQIIKTYKKDPSIKTIGNIPTHEFVLNLNEIDISHLVDLCLIKKDLVVEGVWEAHETFYKNRNLTSLMVDFLNSEKDKSWVCDTLELYEISFEEWFDEFEERGKEVIFNNGVKKLKEAETRALRSANLKAMDSHSLGACFSLPAISGKMGEGIYYTVQVPFSQVPTLFKFLEDTVPVEFRSQRTLDLKRAKAFCDYILSRRYDYVVPALTASVSKSMKFNAVEGFNNLGAVQIPMDAIMLIIDGQHRRAGIEMALNLDPTLRDETLSFVLFYDEGLKKAQQKFADINNSMVKPSKALSIVYDHTNKLNQIVMSSIQELDISHAIEMEKTSPNSKSSKVWSISALKKAAMQLTGLNDKKSSQLDDFELEQYKATFKIWLKQFIDNTQGNLKGEVEFGTEKTLSKVRGELVNTHAVFLHSVALASHELCKGFFKDLENFKNIKLSNKNIELMVLAGKAATGYQDLPSLIAPDFQELKILTELKVNKTSSIWSSRIVRPDGTMNPTSSGIKLGAYVILDKLGLDKPKNIEEENCKLLSYLN